MQYYNMQNAFKRISCRSIPIDSPWRLHQTLQLLPCGMGVLDYHPPPPLARPPPQTIDENWTVNTIKHYKNTKMSYKTYIAASCR